MALLTPLTRVSAELAELTRNAGSHANAAASICNQMVGTLLSLSNADATSWLNAQNPADIMQLFTDHYTVGVKLNELLEALHTQLEAADIPFAPVNVDIRPVSDKLADQGRQMTFDGTAFTVSDIPVPEPVGDPEQPVDPPTDPV